MLEMGELQSMMSTITNVMVLRTNGKVLSEEEYLYYESCLKTVKVHNDLRRFIIESQHKEMRRAKKEQSSQGTQTP